jgi:hypothetical protein
MELTAVRPVVERPAPFVTVHAEVGRPGEDARQQAQARWTTIRHHFEHEHVDPALIEQLHERLEQPPGVAGEARRTLVAAGHEVVFDSLLAGRVRWPETAEVSPLPDLGGWLLQADRQLPFILVVADRVGADVTMHRGLADPEAKEREVNGQDFQITKVPEGDWAQKQYQQYAEDTWRRNAEQVAEVVRAGIRQERPRLVVLAGDERARTALADALDGEQVPIVQVAAGGRAAGASEEALWDEVRRVLAETEAHDDAAIAEELYERTGQGAGAARGLEPVLDALVAGQVERLVIDLEAARELRVDPAEHPGLPLPEGVAGEQPADRVLVAAAAATDAACSVLPRAATGGAGVAALLRWDR